MHMFIEGRDMHILMKVVTCMFIEGRDMHAFDMRLKTSVCS